MLVVASYQPALSPIVSFNEPIIYRAVIDEVIQSIRPEFEEFGVGEDVLAELQHVSICHKGLCSLYSPV